MKTTVYVAVLAVLYVLALWVYRPSAHVECLDGPVSTCRNPYHTH